MGFCFFISLVLYPARHLRSQGLLRMNTCTHLSTHAHTHKYTHTQSILSSHLPSPHHPFKNLIPKAFSDPRCWNESACVSCAPEPRALQHAVQSLLRVFPLRPRAPRREDPDPGPLGPDAPGLSRMTVLWDSRCVSAPTRRRLHARAVRITQAAARKILITAHGFQQAFDPRSRAAAGF